MHADVIPFPNFALDLILFALHFAFSVFDLDFAFVTSISSSQTLTFATSQLSVWRGLHDDLSPLCRFCHMMMMMMMMMMCLLSCELVMLISWLGTCFLSSELHDRYAHVALHDFHSHILILQLRSHPVAVCPWNSLCWLCILYFLLYLWCLISLFSLHLLYPVHVRSLCADCTLPSWLTRCHWALFVLLLALALLILWSFALWRADRLCTSSWSSWIPFLDLRHFIMMICFQDWRMDSLGCIPFCHEPELFHGYTWPFEGLSCPLPFLITLPLLNASWLWLYMGRHWEHGLYQATWCPGLGFAHSTCLTLLHSLSWLNALDWIDLILASLFFVYSLAMTTTRSVSYSFIVRWDFASAMIIFVMNRCKTQTLHLSCYPATQLLADGISLFHLCLRHSCCFVVWFSSHVQVPCIHSIHCSELAIDGCLTLSCFALLPALRWSDFVGLCPPCDLFVIWLTLCLSFLSFTVSECLPWVLSIEFFALDSSNCPLPELKPVHSFCWSHDVCQVGSDSKSVLPDLYSWFLIFLFLLVVCHPDCFTWPSLRSHLSLVDLYACCLLGNHVVWGGVLEYGRLMPEGSPHDSPLCPESLTPEQVSCVYIELT